MSSELRDQAARRQITTDLDANLAVEAGAGTGKTTRARRPRHERARDRQGDRR